jgi:hypothetical protein
MPETVIPRAMLQGANETGDYFWDVWREPNDHAARYPTRTAPIFFDKEGAGLQAAAVTAPDRS